MAPRVFVAFLLLMVCSVGFYGPETGLSAPEPRDTKNRPTRSMPPKSWDAETERIFADGPFDLLKGERPSVGSSKGSSSGNNGKLGPATGGNGQFAWSDVISAESIADEIKSYRLDVSKNVRTPSAFKGGGNRSIIRQYSVIAVMFAIAAEYDGDVRWKKIAPGARDAFARAARNAKAADSNTYNESKTRGDDLDELVRGGTVDFPKSTVDTEEDILWNRISERRPLMIRLKQAYEERIRPWTADQGEMDRHRSEIKHEAEMIAAMAEVIQREEYEFHDDDDYIELCKNMQRHALAAAAAVEQNNLAAAQRSLGEMSKTCSACHEGYR